MYHAVTVPEIEGFRSQDTFRQWKPIEGVSEAGVGQVMELSRYRDVPQVDAPSISPAVYFYQWNVEEGQSVGPGEIAAEVMVDGVVVPVHTFLHGVVTGLVEWQEGDRIDTGKILANVATRFDQGSKKTGLNPKPSAAMYFKRTGHFRVS